MIMKIVFTTLLLGIQQIDSSTDSFCYQYPECGPESWPHKYPTCNGTRQSPIDIKTNTTLRMDQLGPFFFQGYNESNFLKIKHTKKTIRVSLDSGMKVMAGGLPGTYLPLQFHLHWGETVASGGSEHRLDGQQYGMELHIVHRRDGINLTEAFSEPQGLAVLGFFIKIESNIQENPSWKTLTHLVKNLPEDGDELPVNATLSLMDLIGSVNLTKYFRYNGSLTTPECDEVVLWTIFQEPIRLNASLVETFFTNIFVNTTQGSLLHNTFRPIQQNVNPVWASQDASTRPPTPSTTPPPAPSTTPPPAPSTTSPPAPSTTSPPAPSTTSPPTISPPTTSPTAGNTAAIFSPALPLLLLPLVSISLKP